LPQYWPQPTRMEETDSIVGQVVDQKLPSLPVVADCHQLHQATFEAIETRLKTHFGVVSCRPIPIRPRWPWIREESVGLINQAKISQRSEADVRADHGPVHRATRRKHPRHARKALLVLDDRGAFDLT